MSSEDKKTANSENMNSQGTANNMVVLFADQIRKGLIPWYNVPKALRPAVDALLNRGE